MRVNYKELLAALLFTIGSMVLWVQPVTASSDLQLYNLSAPNDWPYATNPYDIVKGSDGNVWFTVPNRDIIGKMTSNGIYTEYGLPENPLRSDGLSQPYGIALGQDGAIWFTERLANKIGRLTTSGNLTEFSIPTPNSTTENITAGPDNALWFTERDSSKIGRISLEGVITEFNVPRPSSGNSAQPESITTGSDNSLWFTHHIEKKISRITVGGEISEYILPRGDSVDNTIVSAQGVTKGSDGALWFTSNWNQIAKLTTDGVFTIVATNAGNGKLYSSPTGLIWFNNRDQSAIESIDIYGIRSLYPLAVQEPNTSSIAEFNDGSLALSLYNEAAIGKFSITPPDTTAPVVIGAVSPIPNNLGWNNSDVNVSWTATDQNGTANTPAPTTVSQEGRNISVTSNLSCDANQNCATGSTTVNIDKSLPVASSLTWTVNPKSQTETTSFSSNLTDPNPSNMGQSGINRAEYFIGDIDPGEGNASPVTLDNQTVDSNNLVTAATGSATITDTLAPGVYKVNVRVKDNADNWSHIATDFLVTYDATGPKDVAGATKSIPSLGNGDNLPGLNSSTQNGQADLGFDVLHSLNGTIATASQVKFNYENIKNCSKKNVPGCVVTSFNSSLLSPENINWLVINGQNNSVGTFQGSGTLNINGITSNNPFRIVATDGTRTTPQSFDEVKLYIYPSASNPETTVPLYSMSINQAGNWLKIQ